MSSKSKTVGKQSSFSAKYFLRGMAVIVSICLAIIVWLSLSAESTQKKQEERLASQTVLIKHVGHDSSAVSGHTIQTTPDLSDVKSPAAEGLGKSLQEGLYERTTYGILPKADNTSKTTPFQAYRRPFTGDFDKPKIALVILDLGISNIAAESAIRTMPANVSFAFSPYSESLNLLATESRSRGHEIWLTLPLETDNFPLQDAGPHSIMIGASEKKNQEKLFWTLSRTSGYVGVVTSKNAAFLQSKNDLRPILGNIYSRGLGFIDSSLAPGMLPQTTALGMNAPYGSIDVYIDKKPTRNDIQNSLRLLEDKAREQNLVIGALQPLPVSYQEILKWIDTLPEKGLELAPLSFVTQP